MNCACRRTHTYFNCILMAFVALTRWPPSCRLSRCFALGCQHFLPHATQCRSGWLKAAPPAHAKPTAKPKPVQNFSAYSAHPSAPGAARSSIRASWQSVWALWRRKKDQAATDQDGGSGRRRDAHHHLGAAVAAARPPRAPIGRRRRRCEQRVRHGRRDIAAGGRRPGRRHVARHRIPTAEGRVDRHRVAAGEAEARRRRLNGSAAPKRPKKEVGRSGGRLNPTCGSPAIATNAANFGADRASAASSYKKVAPFEWPTAQTIFASTVSKLEISSSSARICATLSSHVVHQHASAQRPHDL